MSDGPSLTSGPPPVPQDSPPGLPPDCEARTLGVAFFDLSRMSEWSSSEADAHVASFLQAFYELSAGLIEPAGGRIVKLMGDAGLAVFPPESAEGVIFALCELTSQARAAARRVGLDTYLNVSVHVGPVLTGSFGPPGAERFDVLGKTVNIAARLGRRGVTLSAQAFRCLTAEARRRFEKFTPPTTYRFRG